MMEKNSKILRTILIAGAVVLFFSIVIVYNSNGTKESTVNEFGENYKIDILTACFMSHVFVEDKLRSPSTAEFQRCRDALISYEGNQTYYVISYVDSQNGYGAILRTSYLIELVDKQDESWILKNIVFS